MYIVYNMYIQSVIEMRKLNLSHTNLIDSDILHRLHTTLLYYQLKSQPFVSVDCAV